MGTFYYVFVESTLDYIVRMLPGLVGAAIAFFALRPWRLRRLAGLELGSSRLREGALLLFWLFCGGIGCGERGFAVLSAGRPFWPSFGCTAAGPRSLG